MGEAVELLRLPNLLPHMRVVVIGCLTEGGRPNVVQSFCFGIWQLAY